MPLQKRLPVRGSQFKFLQHRLKKQLLLIDAQPHVCVQWEVALAVPAVAVVVERHPFPESVERRGQWPSVFFSVEADY